MINLRKNRGNKQNRNSMMVTGNTSSADGIIQITLNSGCFLTKDIGSLNSKDTIKIYNYLCSLLVYSMRKVLNSGTCQSITVVIDATKVSVKCLRLVLKACQNALAFKIRQAVIVHPEKFINQQKINLDILLENYNFKTTLSTRSKLCKYVNMADLIDAKALTNTLMLNPTIFDLKKEFEDFFRQNPSYITNADKHSLKYADVNNKNIPNLNKFLQKEKCLLVELDQPNYGRYSRLFEQNDPLHHRINNDEEIYEKIEPLECGKQEQVELREKGESDGPAKTRANLDLFLREDEALFQRESLPDASADHSSDCRQISPPLVDDSFLKLIDSQKDCINELLEWVNGPGMAWLKSLNDVGESIDECRQLDKQHKQLSVKTEQIVDQSSEIVEIIDFLAKESSTAAASVSKLELIHAVKSLTDLLINAIHEFRKKVKQQTLVRSNSLRFHEFINEFYAESDKLLQSICIESKPINSGPDQANSRQNELRMLLEKMAIVEEKYQVTAQASNNFDNLLDQDFLQMQPQNRKRDVDFVSEQLQLATERRKRCQELLDLHKLKLQQIIQLEMCEKDQEQVIQWINELSTILLSAHFRKNLNVFQLNSKINHFEQSGISCREYGKQLSQVSLFLRRSLRVEISPQLSIVEHMNSVWREFERNVNRHRSL